MTVCLSVLAGELKKLWVNFHEISGIDMVTVT